MHPPDVLAPARLGPVELRNRIIKAATFEGMTPRALVTDGLVDFHLRPARGGVGMTTVAYCAVSPEGRTDRHQIWMRPEAVPGLRRLTDDTLRRQMERATPLGRIGDPADVAAAVVFLASPAGGYITGKIIEVDGGIDRPNLDLGIPDL